jgi:hypothetical protein
VYGEIMKKIIFFLLIVIFALLGVLCFKKKIIKEETNTDIVRVLKGDKIEENVYGIKLNDGEKGFLNFSIVDENNIYYSVNGESDDIALYKYDLYNGENEKIIEKLEYYDCKKYNELIGCAETYKTDFYDKDGNFIVTMDGENIVYNNGIYYSILNNKIIDSDNKEYFVLDDKYSLYDLIDYFIVNDIIYTLYFKFDDNKNYSIICDTKNNKCVDNKLDSYYKYENGLFSIENNKIIIYDVINDKYSEYDIKLNRSKYFTTYFDKNNIFYVYNDNMERLEIINLNDNSVKTFNVSNVDNITIINNMIFLKLLDSDYDYYVIRNDYNYKKYTIDEYGSLIEKELNDEVNKVKEKYNVNLYIKDSAIIMFPDFLANKCDDSESIYLSIKMMESILDKFPKDFFDSLYENSDKGLNVYLTGELRPMDAKTQYTTPSAYTSYYKKMYLIAIDITQSGLESNMCHELMHSIENKLNNMGEYFTDWYKLNPKKYDYSYSYKVINRLEYTIGETSDNNVYFVDYYSHTFPTEDKARVFENVCNSDTVSSIKNYKHLLDKANYLKEVITKYYPSMNETTLFNSIN